MPSTDATATADKLSVARRLVACASIQSIRVLRSATMNSIDILANGGKSEPLTVEIEYSTRGTAEASSRLRFVADYRLKGKRQSSSDPDVDVSATFELIYSVPDDFAAAQSELEAFAETNVVLNSWPYWREFVQSTVVRMNLPPLTLPLFRVVPLDVPKAESDKDKKGVDKPSSETKQEPNEGATTKSATRRKRTKRTE